MFIKFSYCTNYWLVVLYYPKIVNACKKPTFITICLYLSKNKQRIDVIVLTKGLMGDLGDVLRKLIIKGPIEVKPINSERAKCCILGLGNCISSIFS